MKYIDIQNIAKERFRQKQLDDAIFKQLVGSFDDISNFSKDLREKLKEKIVFPSLLPVKTVESADHSSQKVLLKAQDAQTIESVLLRHRDGRNTVCVSTQVGCPMACKFCATGSMGFIRNLTYREIVDQVLFFARELAKKDQHVTNIVFMGMGEPFLNPENTEVAVEILIDPEQFGIGSRSITMSTVGIIPAMKTFFTRHPQINLAISLHSARPEIRKQIMPVASKVSLDDLAQYICEHISSTNRRVTLEYVMLAGINDTRDDVNAIGNFIKKIGLQFRKLIHINLIPFNKTPNCDYIPTSPEVIHKFKEELEKQGINTTTRKSLGQETEAACGMLRGRRQ